MGRLPNYLRTQRRRWHLTQEELAFLFGYFDQSIIAKLEHDERTITLAVAHMCELLFGIEPREIFPFLFDNIEARAMERMHELRDKLLQGQPTHKRLAKLTLLQEALNRRTIPSEQEL